MLDEPSHSRQWVARRLQRALIIERWAGGLREGLSALDAPDGPVLAGAARQARRRIGRLVKMLEAVGASPYGSLGLAWPVARLAGRVLAGAVPGAARQAARRIVAHGLAEYAGLEGLIEDAPGVPAGLGAAAADLRRQLVDEARHWERRPGAGVV